MPTLPAFCINFNQYRISINHANKNSNVSYDQIPHIVINHPNTKPEHISIMRALYKVLKDKKQCIYSNQSLSIECRIPLRTVERRISELKKMMFINSIGTSYNRRISLGLLFNTSASVADKNLTPPPKSTSQTAKSDSSDRHTGGHTNPSTKPSTKGKTFSKEEEQEKKWYLDNPMANIRDEHRYLFIDNQ